MCDENGMECSDVHVIIETTNGAISGVLSDGDNVNVAIIERSDLDENAVNYHEDIIGAPGMLLGTFIADTTDIDLHELWVTQFNDTDDVEN
jgi:hypothetical protein